MYEGVFLFAAKVGSLEGYLYRRRKVESLVNGIENITVMYHELAPAAKREVSPALVTVLERILKYGRNVLELGLRDELQRLLEAASAEAGVGKEG